MKKIVIYLFFSAVVFIPHLLQANEIQNSKAVDSLLTLLNKDKKHKSQVVTLNELSWEYQQIGKYDSAFYYANAGLQLAKLLNFQKGISDSYNRFGNVYDNQGNYSKALENNFASLKIRKEINDKQGMASAYNNIGLIYYKQGNYEKALENNFASLKIKEDINDKQGIASSYNNIAMIYNQQNNYNKAIENFLLSLKIRVEIGDKKGVADSYNNIGTIFGERGNYNKALENFQVALRIQKEIGDKLAIAASYNNIGRIYSCQNVHSKALENYFASLKIREEIGDKHGIVTSFYNIASHYSDNLNYTESIVWLKKGLQIAKQIGVKDLVMELYLKLALVSEKMNDFQKAYQYHLLFSQIKDSLFNNESTRQIAEIQTKYETEKKEDKLQMQQLLLEQKSTHIYALIALSILVLIIAILLIWQMRTKANSKTLEMQQKLLRSQMNPHFIFNALLSIQNYMFENNPHDAAIYLSKYSVLMRLILENSREEYIPLQNEINTLEHYLELQQLRYENRFNYVININGIIDIDFIAIPPMLAQPFIENAIEHGLVGKKGDGEISISFKQDGKNISFEVEDNGKGLTNSSSQNETKNNHKSLATIITKERLDIMNRGRRNKIRYKIIDLGASENTKKTGTKVIFSIPYKYL